MKASKAVYSIVACHGAVGTRAYVDHVSQYTSQSLDVLLSATGRDRLQRDGDLQHAHGLVGDYCTGKGFESLWLKCTKRSQVGTYPHKQ